MLLKSLNVSGLSDSDMDTNFSGRKECPFCEQLLASAAYYRHVNESVCPKKPDSSVHVRGTEPEDSDSSMSLSSFEVSSCIDSSFCFDTSESEDSVCSQREFPEPGNHTDSESDVDTNSCTDTNSLASEEEIWENSSDEDISLNNGMEPISIRANKILYTISFFLNFFQLTFRISERAMAALLTFIRVLLSYVGSVSQNSIFIHLSSIIPKSLVSIRKYFKDRDGVYEYVVCPKCHSLYETTQCILKEAGREQSKHCDFVEFPQHPHSSRRSKCNTALMKWVRNRGKSRLVPRKTFVYQSLIAGIQKLLMNENFLSQCDMWKQSAVPRGTFCDIYNGKVWQEFFDLNGSPFLTNTGNLCLMLNIDWFNPYEETQYSVGAIYLVVQNLPRSERFKVDNIILFGLIPGPREPKSVNTYLDLLVEDLRKLYRGVILPCPTGDANIRAVLSCIVCDLPATRKVCGFLGVNATKGCSKCLKLFPTSSFGSKPDYSGYQCENWTSRTHRDHYQKCILSKNAKTATDRKRIEKENGARYTELLRLPYFDIIRFHVVDPMHNLFLGIAKHTTETWKSLNLLRSPHFFELQSKVDRVLPPPKIGRIPRKISSGFSSFTADEWKNWILAYSIYSLKGVLPEPHYSCWCIFVKACTLICQLVVTYEDIQDAHHLIIAFCTEFENLYGKEYCTPNMHMACHICDNMIDYGPLAAFWAFSFERYNGTLENTKLSWCGPEKQMFTKFLDLQSIRRVDNTDDSDFFKAIHQAVIKPSACANFSSVEQTKYNTTHVLEMCQYYSCPVYQIDATEQLCHRLLPPLKEKCFNDLNMEHLQTVYSLLYPMPDKEVLHLERFYYESKQIVVNGEEYITTQSRSQRSTAIIAHWPGVVGIDTRGEAPVRVGILMCVFRHTALIRDNISNCTTTRKHIFTEVKWFEDHPNRYDLHSSAIISATTHSPESPAIFLPFSRIIARCAIVKDIEYKFTSWDDMVCISIPFLKRKFD